MIPDVITELSNVIADWGNLITDLGNMIANWSNMIADLVRFLIWVMYTAIVS